MCNLDQLDICEVFLKEFLQKTTIFRSHFWKKSSKKVGTFYIKICFLKNVTKGNRLVLVFDLYQAKHMFSADANSLWKVVCLNVYVQGTILIANAHCAYFAIVKFFSMHFVVCTQVAWKNGGCEDESWWNPQKKFFFCFFFYYFLMQFIMFLTYFKAILTEKRHLLAKKCFLDQ